MQIWTDITESFKLKKYMKKQFQLVADGIVTENVARTRIDNQLSIMDLSEGTRANIQESIYVKYAKRDRK